MSHFDTISTPAVVDPHRQILAGEQRPLGQQQCSTVHETKKMNTGI